jgi:nucleoside-diphosphate-sugar epimerase
MKNILVIGGAGYVGTYLSLKLASFGHKISVYDLFIYGDNIVSNYNISKIKGDIRDISFLEKVIEKNEINTIIHLACISNDPSFELDPDLGKKINFDCFEPLIQTAKRKKIKRFIYASSSSVYGIKSEENVYENMSLEPLTDYSKFKAMCEDVLFKNSDDEMCFTILRPATVCGYSPRQRFDLVVNILTNLAYNKSEITVYGGNQYRPNIHIEDMVDAYIHILEQPEDKINKKIYNVGFENYTVNDIAKLVKEVINDDIEIKKVQTMDERSYKINSDKIREEIGFSPKKNIRNSIEDLKKAFDQKKFKNPLDNEYYFNIKRMNSIRLK